MFDILQPSSLIPYQKETKQPEPVYKPALVIPISSVIKIIPADDPAPLPNDSTPMIDDVLPFSEWKMPEQAQGYIRGGEREMW